MCVYAKLWVYVRILDQGYRHLLELNLTRTEWSKHTEEVVGSRQCAPTTWKISHRLQSLGSLQVICIDVI